MKSDQQTIIENLRRLIQDDLPLRFLRCNRQHYAEKWPDDVIVQWRLGTTYVAVTLNLYLDAPPTISGTSSAYSAGEAMALAEMMREASLFAMAFEAIRKEYQGD